MVASEHGSLFFRVLLSEFPINYSLLTTVQGGPDAYPN